jgi:hypothetical protein
MRRQPTFSMRPREGELGRWRKAAGAEPLNAWIRQVCNDPAQPRQHGDDVVGLQEEAADLLEPRLHGPAVVASPEPGLLTRHVEDGLTDGQRELLRRRGMYDARLSVGELRERLRAAEAMERAARDAIPEVPELEPESSADGLSDEERELLKATGMWVEGEVPPAIRREHLRRAQAMGRRAEPPAVRDDGATAEERRLLRARRLSGRPTTVADLRKELERPSARPMSGMQRWFARRAW